jgi:hypothetical protein
MPNRIKISKAIFVDYVLFASLVAPFALIAVAAVIYLRGDGSMTINYVFAGLALLSVILYTYRLFKLIALGKSGEEAAGYVQSVSFYRDRGRINYSYQYNGISYSSGIPVMKSRVTKRLSDGMTVTVIVNPENPKKSIIKELYVG